MICNDSTCIFNLNKRLCRDLASKSAKKADEIYTEYRQLLIDSGVTEGINEKGINFELPISNARLQIVKGLQIILQRVKDKNKDNRRFWITVVVGIVGSIFGAVFGTIAGSLSTDLITQILKKIFGI